MGKMTAQTRLVAHELNPLTSVHIAPSSKDYTLSGFSSQDRDRDGLARLGKKQVLKVFSTCARPRVISTIDTLQRNFAFMSMLGFSCTMMQTWEGILV